MAVRLPERIRRIDTVDGCATRTCCCRPRVAREIKIIDLLLQLANVLGSQLRAHRTGEYMRSDVTINVDAKMRAPGPPHVATTVEVVG